jgi:N-acetyl sugar amidotransferase
MRYCVRCLYPENAKPTIILDDEGVCSGCRYHESRQKLEINWEERQRVFEKILEQARTTARKRGLSHECIIPVSGGKDSHFQVWLLKEKYGFNPLLVTFNHGYNHPAGLRNLENLVTRSGCDMIRYNAGLDSIRRLSRLMLEKVGDLTWHYHAGIRTFPFQVAVQYNIPLIVWGEHGFAELTGIVSLEDFVEFTRWTRKEHDMRGFEPHDLVGQGEVTERDIAPYVYPTDEQIEATDVRGIYLSNFFPWDAKEQAEAMIATWGFSPISYRRDRTFNLYAKIDDHANDVHDYLKYLKFGYGRATDDASMEIRHGRMSREEGMELVRQYDATEPTSLGSYCDFLGMSKEEFYRLVDHQRDPRIWERDSRGVWQPKDAVWRHPIGAAEERVRVPQAKSRTFAPENHNLYFNPANPPDAKGDMRLDVPSREFRLL